MSEQLVTIAAASATIVAMAGAARILWLVLRYTVRAHDELLGDENRPGVRPLVERLDRDLRDHMRVESDTISTLRADMLAQHLAREGQWATLTARVEQIAAKVCGKNGGQ